MLFSPVPSQQVPLRVTDFDLLCVAVSCSRQDSELFKDRLVSYASL